MSDKVTHECGIALVRLRKPLAYYQEKYGSPLWGFTKLFLLMEKQHNRGQDGAGVACVKLDVPAGEAFMFRERSVKSNPLDKIFKLLLAQYNEKVHAGTIHPEFPDTVGKHFDFGGELFLGHLRYGTRCARAAATTFRRATRFSGAAHGPRAILPFAATSTSPTRPSSITR